MKTIFFAISGVVIAAILYFIVVVVGKKDIHKLPSATPSAVDVRNNWHDILHWSKECESDWLDSQAPEGRQPSTQTGIDVSQISSDESVIIVTCGIAAYQKNFLVYLYNQKEKSVKPQKFVVYSEDIQHKNAVTKSEDELLVGNLNFDKTTKTLTVLTLERGADDCGSQTKYTLVNQDFVLKEFRAQFNCGLKNPQIDPNQWPLQRSIPSPNNPTKISSNATK